MKLFKLQGMLIIKFKIIGGFSGLDTLFLKPYGGYMGVHFITTWLNVYII